MLYVAARLMPHRRVTAMFLLGLRWFAPPPRRFQLLLWCVELTNAVDQLTVALWRLGRLKELSERIL